MKQNKIIDKLFNKLIKSGRKIDWSLLCQNSALSMEFFENYIFDPEYFKCIDWDSLSTNPSITVKFVETFKEKMNWSYLSVNHGLPESFFLKYIDKFDYIMLTRNKGLSEQFFRVYMNHKKWNIMVKEHVNVVEKKGEENSTKLSHEFFTPSTDLVENGSVYYKHYEKERPVGEEKVILKEIYNDKKIFVKWLCKNPNISENFFLENIDLVHWPSLCSNTNISEQFFEDHMNRFNIKQKVYPGGSDSQKTCWMLLCRNKNISDSFFKKYIKQVNWYWLSTNPNISEDFILKYKDKIVWRLISKVKHFSESFIKNYSHLLDWNTISGNKTLPLSFFKNFYHKLNHKFLCYNNSLDENFLKNMNKDWQSLSYNNNISPYFFLKNLDKIDCEVLCGNNFHMYLNSTWFCKVTGWVAHPDWYNYDHSISISENAIYFSHGESQAMRNDCKGTWKIKNIKKNETMEQGILSIKYKDKKKGTKDIPYIIYKGQYIIQGHYNIFKKQFFEYKIVFKKDPFPCVDYPNYIDGSYYNNDFIFYGRLNNTEKIEEKLHKAYSTLSIIHSKRRKRNREKLWNESLEPEYEKKRKLRETSYFSTIHDEKILSQFNDA